MSAIMLTGVSLDINFGNRRINVLNNASFEFPIKKIALIAETRSHVVAIIDLLSRRLIPQAGQIRFAGRVSWPIGHIAPFAVAITGTQAVSHLATLYNFDRRLALDFLRAEFEAANQLSKPILSWSRLQQSKFMLLMALIVPFDVYLVDGNIVLPEDVAFTRRFLQLFLSRVKDRTVLITARQVTVLRMICDSAVVIRNGQLNFSTDVNAALALSNSIPSIETSGLDVDDTQQDDGLLF